MKNTFWRNVPNPNMGVLQIDNLEAFFWHDIGTVNIYWSCSNGICIAVYRNGELIESIYCSLHKMIPIL